MIICRRKVNHRASGLTNPSRLPADNWEAFFLQDNAQHRSHECAGKVVESVTPKSHGIATVLVQYQYSIDMALL